MIAIVSTDGQNAHPRRGADDRRHAVSASFHGPTITSVAAMAEWKKGKLAAEKPPFSTYLHAL